MMDKKNIFVVGGSSGIGLEIVKKLHSTGSARRRKSPL
jgi:NAD(P)-dependent dehydrogenase (short-subunit alcohol dehydrogenase family)